jgi:CBS domain-containing protein
MSPRAACRLETLGFEHVHDYVEGKADWLARGLPVEGERAGERRVGNLARRDVAICRLSERMRDVRSRVEGSPYGFALVVSDDEVLLGRLRRGALESNPDRSAEEAMEPGPSTVRYDLSASDLAERLDRRDLRTAVVTTPDGALVGILRRADLSSF